MRQHTVQHAAHKAHAADRGINAYYGNAFGRMRGSHKRLCVWRILGMAMLCLAQAAIAQPETVIWSSEDKSDVARTGESWYNFVATSGSGTASISNLDNPIDENGYAGILGVNLDLKDSWNNWGQATLVLDAKNNGVDYDFAQCSGGFSYTYKDSTESHHRFSTHYPAYYVDRFGRDDYSPSVSFYKEAAPSNNGWITNIMKSPFERDEYDEAYQYCDGDHGTAGQCYGTYPLRDIQFDWSKVKNIQWTIRPIFEWELRGMRGSLQISEVKCLGDLDLSSVFGVFGSKSMTLAAGYAATSTGAFTVLGDTEVEFECEDCDGKIAWNAGTKKLDIAAGLPAGTYAVALTATNAKGTKEHEFTLTVEANTPIIAAAPKAGTLKARVQNGTLHLSGLTAGKTWSVYNASGALVHSGIASGTEATLRLNASGLYFVRSGAQVGKVLSVVK